MSLYIKISLILLSVFAVACSKMAPDDILSSRERDNIFDPKNNKKTIEAGFGLTSQENYIRLYWNPPHDVIYKSFNLYRKTAGQDSFKLRTVILKGNNYFNDSDIIFDQNYSYYLTINGETEESYPTQIKSITPGPGNIWMLDRYLWDIVKLSYDLSAVSLRKAGAWRPENMAMSKKIGLITYPVFRYLEIFNLENGRTIDGNLNLRSPFDATYDPVHGQFWVVDSTGSIYTIDTVEANEQLVYQDLKKPVQIEYMNNHLFVLDRGFDRLFIFNSTPLLTDSVGLNNSGQTFSDLKLFRLDEAHNNCYLLDGKDGANTLYKYSLDSKQIEAVFTDSLIYSFDVNRRDESIWIVIANKVNSQLLQLSPAGNRLHTIDGMVRPTDVKINPYNENVVVADFYGQKVYHYRPDLSLVGIYSTIGDPFKVYIQ